MTNWTGGVPDPEHPGLKVPDLIVLAVTDEGTGEMLPKPKMLAGFTLQEVGGPPIDERPDATGLFSDGRFLDFSDSKNALGQAGNFQNREQNRLHSVSVTDDGERVYVAGTTAGFYVLNSEAVAHATRCAAWPPARPDATSARRSSRPAASSTPRSCPRWPTTACTWS